MINAAAADKKILPSGHVFAGESESSARGAISLKLSSELILTLAVGSARGWRGASATGFDTSGLGAILKATGARRLICVTLNQPVANEKLKRLIEANMGNGQVKLRACTFEFGRAKADKAQQRVVACVIYFK